MEFLKEARPAGGTSQDKHQPFTPGPNRDIMNNESISGKCFPEMKLPFYL